MGGGGRGDMSRGPSQLRGGDITEDVERSPHLSLAGPPCSSLAAAVEERLMPSGASDLVTSHSPTEPLAEVVRVVTAARRLEGWSLWAQLGMLARLIAAWTAQAPVSNDLAEDRCAEADPALAQRLNGEIYRFQRSVRGHCSGKAENLAPLFATAEISLACGLTKQMSSRRVDAAQALFLEGRLPRMHRLLRYGWVDWHKLDAFVHDTCHLDAVVANAVERIVIGDLPGEQSECPEDVDVLADPGDPGADLPAFVRMTVPELRTAIAGAITAIDAEAAAHRARKAREGRGVRCEPGLDGMATLTADWPSRPPPRSGTP
jgi:hypothetical protein